MAAYGRYLLPPLKLRHNPFFNDLNQFLAAFFDGLACCPNTNQTGNMSIIRLRVIDYLIFGFFQGCLNIFCEHVICC